MKNITLETFKEVLDSQKPIMIIFVSQWCSGCKSQLMYMDGLEEKYSDVVFGSINADKEVHINTLLNIQTTPTTLLFHHGKVIDAQLGVATRKRLLEMLDKARESR